jgi:hypothetical protein
LARPSFVVMLQPTEGGSSADIASRGAAMRYVALIYGDQQAWDSLAEADREALYARYRSFADDARAAGVLVEGSELQGPDAATTVRVRGDETLVTDGPFVELKEALGGYFILECGSLDDACAWAARIPSAEQGAIEVRPTYVDEEEGS